MNHGRIPWLTPDELDAEQRRVYEIIVGGPRAQQTRVASLVDDAGRLQGPFNAMLFDPVVGEAVQNLGSLIRYATGFEPRSREIAILVTAATARSNYEWNAHSYLGRAVGLSDAEIASLLSGTVATTFSSSEALIWRVATALANDGDLDDALFAEAESALGLTLLLDLVVLVGYYELLARSLRVWRTPLPEGASPQFP